MISSLGRGLPCATAPRLYQEVSSVSDSSIYFARMTLREFRRVRARIQPFIRTTPVVPCDLPHLNLKLENLQHTHSFKLRRGYGNRLPGIGSNYDAAEAIALEMSKDAARYAFVSPYNDYDVVLGQGSLAFEILEQLPDVRTILVSVGGGGLLAGVAAAAKQ